MIQYIRVQIPVIMLLLQTYNCTKLFKGQRIFLDKCTTTRGSIHTHIYIIYANTGVRAQDFSEALLVFSLQEHQGSQITGLHENTTNPSLSISTPAAMWKPGVTAKLLQETSHAHFKKQVLEDHTCS